MIKVIDDFIPLSHQEEIKNLLLSSTFPWFYIEDVTSNATLPADRSPALQTNFRFNSITQNNYYNYFLPLAHLGASLANYKFNDVTKCRSFLQFPLAKVKPVDPLHVDCGIDHLVVLYYVLDSDGDTIIVDKKCELDKEPLHNLRAEDFTVLQRVTPKQGRVVLFDGRYYHTAEQPRNNLRCILNFNVV